MFLVSVRMRVMTLLLIYEVPAWVYPLGQVKVAVTLMKARPVIRSIGLNLFFV